MMASGAKPRLRLRRRSGRDVGLYETGTDVGKNWDKTGTLVGQNRDKSGTENLHFL